MTYLLEKIQNKSHNVFNKNTILKSFGIEKSRSGIYENTYENRNLGRVGQHYGHAKDDYKEFQSIPEMQLYFNEYDSDIDKLSESQKKALFDYRQGECYPLNNFLRNVSDIPVGQEEKYMNNIKNLDNSFNSIKLKDNVTFQRGVDTGLRLKTQQFFNDLKEGDVFEDSGYVSTTIGGEDVLRRFRSNAGNPNMFTIKILAKKGSKAIPMQNIGNDPDLDTEFEFLLPRKSKFKVIKKQNTNITVELL